MRSTDEMTIDFALPNVTDSGTEVTIVAWHKNVGDRIAVGDVLLEVMTEKVNVEVESYLNGRIVEILRASDSEVRVGDVIARIAVE
jgi:pyruvate/2-oxoglutarate dehydrogenase complex dihydrolipoamide acyltransferase (E2) component